MKPDSHLQRDVIAEPKWGRAVHPVGFVDAVTHRARITGPVPYRSGSGRWLNIPIGPCLVEGLGGRSIDIIWGARGQNSVALPLAEVEAARSQGHLVLLED